MAKKPEKLWLVGILSGIKYIQRENSISGFKEWNLGDKEDKDLVVYDFEHPHDEAEANATFQNEAWRDKLKLALLEAQNSCKENTSEVLEKALNIFPELKSFQSFIYQAAFTGGDHKFLHSPKLFYFCQNIGNWSVLIVPKPEYIGLEQGVADIVNKKEGETLKSMTEDVYKYLEKKQPQSLWIVGVLMSSSPPGFGGLEYAQENLFGEFLNWGLGNMKDKHVFLFEFQHPHDEEKAQATVLNEAWENKVKLAFLEAQNDMNQSVFRTRSDPPGFKDETDLVLERTDKLLPELKKYQRIIFRVGKNANYQCVNSPKLFFFCQVIRNYLVVVIEPPETPEGEAEAEAEPDSLSSINLDDLQLNDDETTLSGINFFKI